MLPFLSPKKSAGVIIAKRVGDKTEAVAEEGEHPPGLLAAAEDMLSAFAAKDANALAGAVKAAFECCEAYEDVEGLE